MFGLYYLRKDLNICRSDGFHLLPSIIFHTTTKYFEINISFLVISLNLSYSINNYNDD